jgi:hypothetical protein
VGVGIGVTVGAWGGSGVAEGAIDGACVLVAAGILVAALATRSASGVSNTIVTGGGVELPITARDCGLESQPLRIKTTVAATIQYRFDLILSLMTQ